SRLVYGTPVSGAAQRNCTKLYPFMWRRYHSLFAWRSLSQRLVLKALFMKERQYESANLGFKIQSRVPDRHRDSGMVDFKFPGHCRGARWQSAGEGAAHI